MNNNILIFTFITLFVITIAQDSCCQQQALSIVGSGRVSIDPDIATFTVYATANGKTSSEALSKVNGIIQKATGILQPFGLPRTNYSTSSINLYPQYNYTGGFSILIGQKASVSLKITAGNLNSRNIVGSLYSALSVLNDISISGLTFDTSNRALALKQARKAAVADARFKADQYVQLGCRGLGKVKKVVDRSFESYTPFFSQYSDYAFKVEFLAIPYGKV